MFFTAILNSASPLYAHPPECGSQQPASVVDPVFNLAEPTEFYNKHFASAPQTLLHACKISVSKSSTYQYWIFALTAVSSGRYIILGGVVRDANAAKSQPDGYGAFLFQPADTAQACNLISWPLDVFCAPDIGGTPGTPVTSDILNALAQDAVHRYVNAFGSPEKFNMALRHQNRVPSDTKLAFLNAAISRDEIKSP